MLIKLDKGYKSICKEFGLQPIHSQTDGGNSRLLLRALTIGNKEPAKITTRSRRVIVSKLMMELMVTSKQLMFSLTLAYVNVYESTIKRTPNNNDVHYRVARRKPLLSKKSIDV